MNYKNELDKIYSKVPSGDCIGCGNCCAESVGASFVEAEVIFDYLKSMDKEKRNKIIEKLLVYIFDIYEMRDKCPFLGEDNRCEIYEVRPLNCRIFGHWNQREYEENLGRLKIENQKIAKNIELNYDYIVKEEYLSFSIPYCHSFKGQIMSSQERGELFDELIILDSKHFVKNGILSAYEDKGIVEHIVDKLISREQIFDLKMKNKLTKNLKLRLIGFAKLKMEE